MVVNVVQPSLSMTKFVSPGITQYSFTNLEKVEGLVYPIAQENLEIWRLWPLRGIEHGIFIAAQQFTHYVKNKKTKEK